MNDSYRNTNAHSIFLLELSKQEKTLNELLSSKNINNNTPNLMSEIKESIHKLKGSADFFEYTELGEKARKLDLEKTKEKISIESIFSLHSEIKNILDKL